ncbi:NAD(P)-dependent oxidoreductase [Aeromonas veronii]
MIARVAFLGLGAMGSRMAARLIQAGHDVTVWNRTPAACEALAQIGARIAASPAEAVVGVDFAISMVRDDQASAAVWCDPQTGALRTLPQGALAIESSTLSPDWVRRLGEHLHASGHALLEAPVSGSRPAAEAGQLVFLLGGEAQDIARAEMLLAAMGSSMHAVGPLGAGALAKLATNALLGIQVVAYAELIALLRHQRVDVAKVLLAIAGTSVWAPVAGPLTGAMLRGEHRPQFPIELIAKDFAYALAAAGDAAQAPMLTAALEVFRQGIQQGLGVENMTAVAGLFSKP